MLQDGDTFIHAGHTFLLSTRPDDSADAPWDREDGHGPVSGWTYRNKRPGELVLSTNRTMHRLYDFAEACRIARRECWGGPELTGTSRQRAAKAARADFDRLRAWCADQWCYVGIIVELLDEAGQPTGERDSLWGVEDDAADFIDETARTMAEVLASDLIPSGLDALRACVAAAGTPAMSDPVV